MAFWHNEDVSMLPASLLDPAFSEQLPINDANIYSMAGEILWCLLELVKIRLLRRQLVYYVLI